MRFFWMMVLCFMLSACGGASPEQALSAAPDELIKEPVAETVVEQAKEIDGSFFEGISGTAVFLDKLGNYTIHNEAESELRSSPNSTFKIISTLAALEYGVDTVTWDHTQWAVEAWNRDLTLAEAFQSSCVWYYRKLIDEIGKKNMMDFLEIIDYGNRDISQWEGSGLNGSPLIDGFWLESSLLISPREQVDVIYRIFEGETEIADKNIAELKKMMADGDKKLYGKTGSGKGGWFVGFFEADGENTYFAVYLNGQTGTKAKEIAEKLIHECFLIN